MDKLGKLQAEQRRRAYYITGAVMALAERDDLTDAQVRERVKALAKVYNAGTLQEHDGACYGEKCRCHGITQKAELQHVAELDAAQVKTADNQPLPPCAQAQ